MGYLHGIMILYKQIKEIMKQSLLAIALATIALSSTAHAAYVYKLPLEVAGGGSLPNGTITFGNGGATTPTVPTEPEPIDPDEPIVPEKCADYVNPDFPSEKRFWPQNYKDVELCQPQQDTNPAFLTSFYDYVPAKIDNCPVRPVATFQGGIIINQRYRCGADLKPQSFYNITIFAPNANAKAILLQVKRIVVDGYECSSGFSWLDATGGSGGWLTCTGGKLWDYPATDTHVLVKLYR